MNKLYEYLSLNTSGAIHRLLTLTTLLLTCLFAAKASAEIIIDNSDSSGISFTGTWGTSAYTSGYEGADYAYNLSDGDPSKLATYTPDIQTAGDYEVYLSWTSNENRSSSVPISVVSTAGTTQLTVDQTSGGGNWNLIGTFNFAVGTSGKVEIGTAGTSSGEAVIADAVRFVPVGAYEAIIDNNDPEAVLSGTWYTSTYVSGYYGSDYIYDGGAGKTEPRTVTFTPDLPTAGDYDVSIRWLPGGNRADNVPIDIVTATGTEYLQVDQNDEGRPWVSLGTYSFNAGTGGSVMVSNAGTGSGTYVIVDAVRFYRTGSQALADIIIDNNDPEATVTGSWPTSTTNPTYYGSNYLHDGNTDKGSKSVEFTPDIQNAGLYEIMLHWTADSNRASNAPVTLTTATGVETFSVNQKVGGGEWQSFGVFNLSAGTGNSLLLGTTGSDGYVIADAARFSEVSTAPFTLDYVPEMLLAGWFQEDLSVGQVATHPTVGILSLDASQSSSSLRPTRVADDGGVEFGPGDYMSFPFVKDTLQGARGIIGRFRVESNINDDFELFGINSVGSNNYPGNNTPLIYINNATELIVFVTTGGPQRPMWVNSGNIVLDGETWNTVVVYRRHGHLHVRVNGVEATDTELDQIKTYTHPYTFYPQQTSQIGASSNNGTWAYDFWAITQSELTENQVAKLEGWAVRRAGNSVSLPTNHPYYDVAPIMDQDDFPDRYTFNSANWYGEFTDDINDDDAVEEHTGDPTPSKSGWERVFYDDFRVDSVARSEYGFDNNESIWFGPGWNTGVGAGVTQLVHPQRSPDMYPHSTTAHPDAESGGTLTLALQKVGGSWWGSCIQSVDEAGTGRAWGGERIFRMRCKFPDASVVYPSGVPDGFFPAFWSYGEEALFWRTGERLEIDFFEFDGEGPHWMNGMSFHTHSGRYGGHFGHLASDASHRKMWGGPIGDSVLGTGNGIDNFWDGEFHVWEARFDADHTILSVDGIEIGRVDTPPEALERFYLMADMILRNKTPFPDETFRHDFIIDWIDVWQKTSHVDSFAAPYTARPTITGTAEVGETLTCNPNVSGVTDLRYYWYADDYPLGWYDVPTLTVPAEAEGTQIRCMVKAVGSVNSPEAWTALTSTVAP